jgi:hypothetical protein
MAAEETTSSMSSNGSHDSLGPAVAFTLDRLAEDDAELSDLMFARRLRDSKSPDHEGDTPEALPADYDPGSPLTEPEENAEGPEERDSVKAESEGTAIEPEELTDIEEEDEEEEEEQKSKSKKRKAPSAKTSKRKPSSTSKAPPPEPAKKAASTSKNKKAGSTEPPAKKRKR